MSQSSANIVICGAGIAGISAAYCLAVKHKISEVVLVDKRPPLSLTSDKSTEAYRNWWPGPDNAMRQLMNRSIDLLEGLAAESGNRFLLNRRGYIYATADPDRAAQMERDALEMAAAGWGAARIHVDMDTNYVRASAEGYADAPDGVDLLLNPKLIQKHFPYLTPSAIALLHSRRCGWFSGQQLGAYLLEQAKAHGARLIHGKLVGVSATSGRISGVDIVGINETMHIETPIFVNAAGPLAGEVSTLVGVEIPLYSELHLKVSFNDTLEIIPREAPLLIWEDAQRLPWRDEEREWLAESTETAWLLERFPAGVHCRPEGSDGHNLLALWSYHLAPVEPTFPIQMDEMLPEIVLRGLATMIPGLSAYFDQLPKPFIDGGYYTKTRENRLLASPMPVAGAYLLAGLSGYGLMASQAAAELLAAYIAGNKPPPYAPAFHLNRYENADYLRQIENWGGSLQL